MLGVEAPLRVVRDRLLVLEVQEVLAAVLVDPAAAVPRLVEVADLVVVLLLAHPLATQVRAGIRSRL